MTKAQEKLIENYVRTKVRSMLKEEENKNALDNRLYIALQDLAKLSTYLSDPKKPITNEEVNKYRNELGRRFRMVDDYIEKYARK